MTNYPERIAAEDAAYSTFSLARLGTSALQAFALSPYSAVTAAPTFGGDPVGIWSQPLSMGDTATSAYVIEHVSAADVMGELTRIHDTLVAEHETLDELATDVLYDNLWELYE